MKGFNVIRKAHDTDVFLSQHCAGNERILNAGSSRTCFDGNCINIDIQNKKGIHCRCDVHDLPFKDNSFDVVILTAVLQYCENPPAAISEIARVLAPRGITYIDAPWIQPYCPDTLDKWRFSRDGLIQLFSDSFVVEECGTSISGGSALSHLAVAITDTIRNRYISLAARLAVSALIQPISWINIMNPHVAGAFYLIGRKKPISMSR